MANVDSVDVTFYGEGGHGAYPHLTKDPIVMSSQFITSVQTIISRNLSPINAGVVTVGSIHGGTKHNIIPNHVDLQITVRSYSDEDRELIISRIKKIAESIAIQNDLPKNLYPIVKLRDEYTPAVFNNPDLAMRAKEILSKELGRTKYLMVRKLWVEKTLANSEELNQKYLPCCFGLALYHKMITKNF